MSADDSQPLIPVLDRIVLLGAAHGFVIEDMKEITLGSAFLYEKEHELQNTLLEAFAEMAFVVRQFQDAHTNLLANGTPELSDYVKQLNEADFRQAKNLIVELHAFDLSTYFKSFLLLAKAVLDKLVPLFSYRFFDNLDLFSDKGDRLIARIQGNKHVQRKVEFIALIERVKREWLDALVDLRDEYAHYSNLKEYSNFWIPGESIGQRKFTGIQDFNPPTVFVAGNRVDALEYVLSIKAELIRFLRDFLQLCEFTPDRRPKHYLSCERCKHVFAQKTKTEDGKDRLTLTEPHIEIQIKDKARDYGVIVCPKCGGKTDTDLQFWKREGLSFSTSPPRPGR
jgi:hypothetical protein